MLPERLLLLAGVLRMLLPSNDASAPAPRRPRLDICARAHPHRPRALVAARRPSLQAASFVSAHPKSRPAISDSARGVGEGTAHLWPVRIRTRTRTAGPTAAAGVVAGTTAERLRGCRPTFSPHDPKQSRPGLQVYYCRKTISRRSRESRLIREIALRRSREIENCFRRSREIEIVNFPALSGN